MSISPLNTLARQLRKLHQSGNPVILTNVYDGITANALLTIPGATAAATSSFAIASALGIADDDLTLEQNLATLKIISHVLNGRLPLSADLQDGYGDKLDSAIRSAIDIGVVGCNIEDSYPNSDKLYDIHEASERIRRVREIAVSCGVPDFVINARTDAILKGQSINDAVARGKAYLEAGADCIFVWGGRARSIKKEEVSILVKALDGRINIKMGDQGENFSVDELSRLGVSRISVGPVLMLVAVEAYKKAAISLLEGGSL